MRLTAIILSVVAFAITRPAIGDDNVKLSPELRILDRFVGTWDMDLTVKPVGADAINVKKTETRTNENILQIAAV